MNLTPPDIKERAFEFAVRIVALCRMLDDNRGVSRTLSNQLLRSGTSIGANIEEANGNLTISLYAVLACQMAEGFPLGLSAWLEPIRQSGLAPADPRRLPTPPNFDDYGDY